LTYQNHTEIRFYLVLLPLTRRGTRYHIAVIGSDGSGKTIPFGIIAGSILFDFSNVNYGWYKSWCLARSCPGRTNGIPSLHNWRDGL